MSAALHNEITQLATRVQFVRANLIGDVELARRVA